MNSKDISNLYKSILNLLDERLYESKKYKDLYSHNKRIQEHYSEEISDLCEITSSINDLLLKSRLKWILVEEEIAKDDI